MKDRKDEVIQGKFAEALNHALKKRGKKAEQAAQLLNVKIGTMYKYLAGDMIPGGQVLWRACEQLDMVLDKTGFRLKRSRTPAVSGQLADNAQYELPFFNESIAGDKIQGQVRQVSRKGNQYVRVSLRIKVAG